jgi:dCTP deaminase
MFVESRRRGLSMSLMIDRDIRALVAPAPAKIPGTTTPRPLVSATTSEIGKWDSKIQPASLDLTIGRILLPGEEDDETLHEAPSVSLGQGETVVVETHESLCMPQNVAAVGFPPATISRDGLLMTNPGHIDPGFEGTLKFTVINLGKKPIELSSGKPICTLLVFSIEKPDFAYNELDKTEKPPSPSDIAQLSRLSKDFLSFSKRIKDTVASELRNAQIRTPIISAILAILLTIVANYLSGVSDLKAKVASLEKSIEVTNLKVRIDKLEQKK